MEPTTTPRSDDPTNSRPTHLTHFPMQDKPQTTSPAPAPLEGKPSGFRSLVGYHPVVWEEGHAVIHMVVRPEHLNSLGIIHGGVYMTLMDAAMGHAVSWASVKGNVRRAVTLSLTTRFVTAAKAGVVINAVGDLVSVDGRMATVEGRVVDAAGTLLATGQSTFMYLPGSERREGVPRAKPAGG